MYFEQRFQSLSETFCANAECWHENEFDTFGLRVSLIQESEDC